MPSSAVKIPTLEQMKKDRLQKTMRYSIESMLTSIHSGLCAKMEFIDIPFVVYNEEDKGVLDKIVAEFKKKKYVIEKMAEIPNQHMTSGGLTTFITVINRVNLGEPRMKFVAKMEKEEVKSKVKAGK